MTGDQTKAFTWEIHSADVGHLVGRIFDPTRTEPMVVVSPASDTMQPRIDVEELKAAVPPGTEIAVLASMGASSRLSDTVDSAFHCYGGGVRVVLPGATRSDHWRRHPLVTIYPDDDRRRSIRRIVELVETAAARPGPVTVVTGSSTPTGSLRGDQAEALAKLKQSLEGTPRPVPKPVPHPPHVAGTPAAVPEATVVAEPAPTPAPEPAEEPRSRITVEDITALLDSQTERVTQAVRRAVTEDMLEIFGDNRDATARERSRADNAEQALAELQRRYDDRLEDDHSVPTVFADPEQQLRWEVEHEWLTGTSETERVPLRGYTLAPDFLGDLTKQIVPRTKTVQVVVDILTSRVWTRRQCHQLNDGARGGTQRVRPDGAAAWRVYVKAESSGAPRLTWWELVDGTVELEHVGHHDDYL